MDISTYNPKPVFNLNWYTNDDKYSDGDVEDVIVKLIAENAPNDYEEAIFNNFSWPVYYHLTHVRQNILNWYPFKKGANVLEIGCGFGGITSLLCDKCDHVTAVELSKRRATGALLRCRERENLEIIVGNLNDIEFSEKYDYITLIGVLEYQGRFTNSADPYCDFLKKIKGLLKPDGKLLVAIENQFGVKYWCGAMEDHTGVPYDGMNVYRFTQDGGIRTFSHSALKSLLERSGFLNTCFYYPMPDYKLPTVVYSEKYLPKTGVSDNVKYYYAHNGRSLVADEKYLYPEIIENGAFEFMANSFFVECSQDDNLGEVIYASLTSNRQPEYRIGTGIRSDGKVVKFPINSACVNQIETTAENTKKLAAHGLNMVPTELKDGVLIADFVKEENFEDVFVKAVKTRDLSKTKAVIDRLYEDILLSSEQVPPAQNMIIEFGLDDEANADAYGPILAEGYVDMIFRNAFVDGEKLLWFDQEWMLENIPAKHIIYRALATTYYTMPELNDYIPIGTLYEACGLSEIIGVLTSFERNFTGLVFDELHMREANVKEGTDNHIILGNIKKLVSR